MKETDSDVDELQRLLDSTYANAGPHLLDIVVPERRLSARDLTQQLEGYCLLALATVSSNGQPLVSPVDGTFYRGHFYFSTGEEAVRHRHIKRDPRVSATYVPRAEFAVTVHGVAVEVDHHTDEMSEFRRVLIDTYVPHFGESFAGFVESIPNYYRFDAHKMYCYWRPDDES